MHDYAALAALSAVLDLGSFERAAARLHITPGAVSQRIRQLEERTGAPLVIRDQPCTATPIGARLARHADEVGVLEAALTGDLSMLLPEGSGPRLSIAVNADSLATWFADVMVAADELMFDLQIEDEAHSSEALRRGSVSAAVTATIRPEAGCRSDCLGDMRYRATASPDYMTRWFPTGVDAVSLASAPLCVFSARDRLQDRWMTEQFGTTLHPPAHRVPSTEAFVQLALAGVGWGMNPAMLVDEALADGRLVELLPDSAIDVALYWQTPRLLDGVIDRLSAVVKSAAANRLVRHRNTRAAAEARAPNRP